jgi:excisionase family DNA binding protein
MTIEAILREAVAAELAPLRAELRALRDKIEPPKEWITIQEAAEQYGKSPATIRRWIKEGSMEARGPKGSREVRRKG